MIYIVLFLEFFKVGLFTIGGGLASLPLLYELAEKYTWINNSMIADMIAISQSTPGPIGINMATYAGFKAGGILGFHAFQSFAEREVTPEQCHAIGVRLAEEM